MTSTAGTPSRPRRSRRPRSIGTLLAASLATLLLLVGIPAAETGAYLTSKANVSTAATMGEWCAVPSSTTHPNVYNLRSFPTIAAPEPGRGPANVRMIELPVVRDASFAPIQSVSGARGQIGIRLWSCSETSRLGGQLKATSWRGDYDDGQSFSWATAPTLGSFAKARLNPSSNAVVNTATNAATNPGAELRDLHRGLNELGGRGFLQADKVTMRYSWMLDSYRSPTNPSSDPSCGSQLCELRPGDGAAISAAFSNSSASVPTTGTPGRTATYSAEKYWSPGGRWGCFLSACAPSASLLDPAAGETVNELVRDTSGTSLQWVVLEWFGTADVPADLAVEVYVIP